MTDILWFMAGTLTGVPVLYGSFLLARWFRRRRDERIEIEHQRDELLQFQEDMINLSEGVELVPMTRAHYWPRLPAARARAKKTAQAFIKRYAGCAVPEGDRS
jgi:hypothetical protein